MLKEFKAFLLRGNVVDLAVAVVIGGAFGAIVKSLTDDIIMPPLGLLTGKLDFSSRYVLLQAGSKAPPPYATPAEAKAAGAVTLNYGVFINSLITFIIIAGAVFIVVRMVNRMVAKPEATATTKPCPQCTLAIPLAAVRCPNCTAQIA